MVVRRRHPRLVVDVGQDLKPELGVFVQYLEPTRHLGAAIFFDELLLRKQPLQPRADLLASSRSRITLENGTAIGHELIESVGHGGSPQRVRLAQLRSSRPEAPVPS